MFGELLIKLSNDNNTPEEHNNILKVIVDYVWKCKNHRDLLTVYEKAISYADGYTIDKFKNITFSKWLKNVMELKENDKFIFGSPVIKCGDDSEIMEIYVDGWTYVKVIKETPLKHLPFHKEISKIVCWDRHVYKKLSKELKNIKIELVHLD